MGQKIREDKIGALSYSSGNVLMTASPTSPAYLTIGGQQYKITTQLSVALPSLSANSRYQVFAVQTAGVVSLVISTNENSTGPSGRSSWKLVGSFYSDGNASVGFGSFANIEGAPTADWVNYTPTITGSTSNPSKGTILMDQAFWRRIGDSMQIRYQYRQTSAGGAGSGAYYFSLPSGYSAGLAKTHYGPTLTGSMTGAAGTAEITGGGANPLLLGAVQLASPTTFGVYYGTDAVATTYWGSGTTGNFSTTNLEFSLILQVPISGWSNTPIKDR